MPSSRSSAITKDPSSIPNLRRIRAGTTMAPRFPTRLVSVRGTSGWVAAVCLIIRCSGMARFYKGGARPARRAGGQCDEVSPVPLPPRPRQALPAHRQTAAGGGVPRHRDRDVPRDGHALLAHAGRGRNEERGMKAGRYGPFPYTPINRRPKISWPNGARVALWVIPNVETFPLDEPVPGGTGKAPDIINWAPRDYGNRVGVFRLMDVLARHGVRGTVALNSEVCDDYPQVIEDARTLDWEFMGHNQSNARYLHLMSPDEERGVVLGTFE